MAWRFILWLMIVPTWASHAAPVSKPKPHIGNISFPNAYFADPTPLGEFQTLVIPIKRALNLILIEAKLDSVEGNFVLDSGAPYLVLNQTYFRDAPRYADQESGGINGENANSYQTIVKNLNIAELHFDRLQADVTDLSNIENSRNIKVLGLLGTRLFAKFAITIDVFQNVLYIHKLDKSGNIPVAEQHYHDPIIKMPFYYTNNAIFLKADVNKHTLWFAFDTGAESNLIDYHLVSKLMPSTQIISRSKLTGIGGSSFEVIYARFDELIVGGRTFTNNKVLITDLDKMGKSYGHNVDGILGCDFFSRGVFSINFVKREFSMYENKYH